MTFKSTCKEKHLRIFNNTKPSPRYPNLLQQINIKQLEQFEIFSDKLFPLHFKYNADNIHLLY